MNPAIMASLTALQPHARLLSLMGTVLGVAIGSTAAASYSYYTLRMTAEAQQNAAELLKAELVKEKEVRETSLSHMNELLKAELVKEKELRMAELVKGKELRMAELVKEKEVREASLSHMKADLTVDNLRNFLAYGYNSNYKLLHPEPE